MAFIGPRQIFTLDADQNVARVEDSETLAVSVNNGLAAAENVAKAHADTLVGADRSRLSELEPKVANNQTRIDSIETLAGLAPGDLSDATNADLIANPASETRAALDTNYAQKHSVGEGGFPVGSGIERIYLDENVPLGGYQPGDLVLKVGSPISGPGSIPNLLAWWDASRSAVAGDLATLPDISGQGRHMVLADGFEKATWDTLDGRNAWRFAPTDKTRYDWNYGTADELNGPVTVAMVLELHSTGNQRILSNAAGAATSLEYMADSNLIVASRGGNNINGPLDLTADRVVSIVVRFDGANSQIRVNGAGVAAGTLNAPSTDTALRLGASLYSASSHLRNSRVGELAVYNRTLTGDEMADLWAHHQERWGIV